MVLTLLLLLAAVLVCIALTSTHSTLRYATRFLFTQRESPQFQPAVPDGVAAAEYFAKVAQATGGARLVTGNKVSLLNDGPQTFDSMIAAINQAQNHVNLESYIFDDKKVGRRFGAALIRKAAAGVQINILYDAFGCIGISDDFLRELTDAGIQLKPFQSIMDLRLWRFNQRDHRKILVVDGVVGFIGGINICTDYLDQNQRDPGEHKHTDLDATRPAGSAGLASEARGWRDIHTRIEGPVVAELQRIFLHTWLNAGCQTNANVRYFPVLNTAGTTAAAIVATDRLDVESRILDTQIGAIQIAQHTVWITQAYFVPHMEFIQSLIACARRGVDVRILLPDFTDSWLVLHASHAHYAALLQAGVKIYHYQPRLLHAKAMVVDGLWATVGSSNVDLRSLELNNEANVVVVDVAFARQMEQLFLKDQAHSTLIRPATWANRGVLPRLQERFALLLKYWL